MAQVLTVNTNRRPKCMSTRSYKAPSLRIRKQLHRDCCFFNLRDTDYRQQTTGEEEILKQYFIYLCSIWIRLTQRLFFSSDVARFFFMLRGKKASFIHLKRIILLFICSELYQPKHIHTSFFALFACFSVPTY